MTAEKFLKGAFAILALGALGCLADPGLVRLANETIEGASLCSPSCAIEATRNGTRLFLAQPESNFTACELEGLKNYGLRLYCSVPPNAYVLEGTAEAVAELAKKSNLLLCTELLPKYKQSQEIKQLESSLLSNESSKPVTAVILASRAEYLADIVEFLKGKGAAVIHVQKEIQPRILAKIQPSLIGELSARSDVAWLEKFHSISFCNAVAAATVKASAVRQDYGLDGEGEMAMVADSGLDTGNNATLREDFQNKKVIGAVSEVHTCKTSWDDTNGHGTHVAGTVCGSGAYNENATGMAPKADLYFLAADIENNDVYPPSAGDLDTARAAGARSMNNSWMSIRSGAYSAYDQFIDGYMHEHPEFLVLFAAANANSSPAITNNCTLSAEACAKNIITVGASQKPSDTSSITQDRGMASFSSRGPTDDGRMKPDLCAPGTSLLSCVSQAVDPMGGEKYTYMSGTSMATPVVTGSSLLVRQYLRQQGYGDPSAALVKALLINGVARLNGSGPGFDYVPPYFPNWLTGYGEVNLSQSLYPKDGLDTLEGSLEDGQEETYEFQSGPNGTLNVTLCWTDPPGNPLVKCQLVNNLDLVCKAGGQTYYANGRGEAWDDINNVEKISLTNLAPQGLIKITVKGQNVMQGPQAYALAVSGAGEALPEPAGPALALLLVLSLFAKRK